MFELSNQIHTTFPYHGGHGVTHLCFSLAIISNSNLNLVNDIFK